ncbi:MAG: hypothetical protein LUG98_00995 [Tannerellaceae bacterium]|nr:hypothetical protein [Tannerellaceae bacterium]
MTLYQKRIFIVFYYIIISFYVRAENPPEPFLQRQDTIGITYLQDDQPGSLGTNRDRIFYFMPLNDGIYEVLEPPSKDIYKGVKTFFQSAVTLATPGRLPDRPEQGVYGNANPLDYFRTASTFRNDLLLMTPGPVSKSVFNWDLGQERSNSTLEDSYLSRYRAGVKMQTIPIGHTNLDVDLRYIREDSELTGRGDGLAWLLYPVYAGADRQEVDRLKEKNGDKQQLDYFSSRLLHTASWKKVNFTTDVSYNRQWDRWDRGDLSDSSLGGMERYEDTSDLLASVAASYSYSKYLWRSWSTFLFDARYGFHSSATRLNSTHHFTRNTHDITYLVKYDGNYKQLMIELSNNHYLSNTVKGKVHHHLQPQLQISWRTSFLNDLLRYGNHTIVLNADVSRSVSEVPLLSRDPAVLSTQYTSGDFNNYTYNRDIFTHTGLKAEEYLHSQLMFRYMHEYNIHFSVKGFYNSTANVTLPVFTGGEREFDFCNVGRSYQYGYQLEAYWDRPQHWSTFTFSVLWQFFRSRNKVATLYGDGPFVKLAGFSDVATVFAKGESVGAIYGTTYRRDTDGSVLTDPAGVPVLDSSLKKIGDPTPDFMMRLYPILNYSGLRFLAVLEYSHGGDRWNGTEALLKTIGNSSGTVPVAGEDFIQKATYFRVAELALQYTYWLNRTMGTNRRRSLTIGLRGHNLFVVSPYKGVDPASVLFGNPVATGLDLFNQPAARQYSITLTLDI